MNNKSYKKYFTIFFTICAFFIIQIEADSNQSGKPVQRQIKRGKYLSTNIVTSPQLKLMPVPEANSDYAIYQSIGKVSNIILGKFKSGDRVITMIQDNNADGKVDLVTHWFVDTDRQDTEGKPRKYCNAENFNKLKSAIINGAKEKFIFYEEKYTISPNKEGIPLIKKLLKTPSNISKYQQGLRIKKLDIDEKTKEMAAFSFSYNSQDSTANIAFDVQFFYRGKSRISPTINIGVYCKKSVDPFALKAVKQLREMSYRYLP